MAAKRGRKTAAVLALVTGPINEIPRQPAPTELNAEQAVVWSNVVASQPADWFNSATKPILVQYCRHVVSARRIAELISELEESVAAEMPETDGAERLLVMMSAVKALDRLQKMQERESRAIASLATKMRITQQAITNHRGNHIQAKKPWDF
jgi:hypothetical protein